MHPDHTDVILEELARLREEVVNTRNVSIKTDNLIKNLSSEVKEITQKQRQLERKSFFNSVVAYIIFTVLIFTGLYLTFDARLEKHQADQALFEKKEAAYKNELTQLKSDLGRWQQIERELLEFERLVREGNKEQAVAKFASLRRVRFSGLLEDLIVRFKAEVAKEKYDAGLELFEQGAFNKADEAFLKSLEYNAEPDYLGNLLYHQGMSALRIKDFPRAAELLRQALGFKHARSVLADARYHLAYAHDRMGEKRTARDLYQNFLERHDGHPFERRARQRYRRLRGQ